MRADGLLQDAAFGGEAGWGVSGESAEEELLREVQQPGEELSGQAAGDSEDKGVEE